MVLEHWVTVALDKERAVASQHPVVEDRLDVLKLQRFLLISHLFCLTWKSLLLENSLMLYRNVLLLVLCSLLNIELHLDGSLILAIVAAAAAATVFSSATRTSTA